MRFDISATNYSYTTLEKLTTYFKSGKSITENLSNNGKYPVFGGNGLRGYTDIYNFDGEYILIGRQGALCGNVKRYNGKFYATEHAIVVKALQDTNYLFYLLQYMNLGQYSGQSAQPGLAVNKVVKLLCLIPNLDEQKKVGELFTKIDARIQSQSKIIKELKSYKNLIQDTIVKSIDNNIELKLKDCCSISTGKLNANAMVENGKYKFFTCAKEDYTINSYSFDGESLLISGNGEVGLIKYYNGKFDAYQRTYVLQNFTINPLFLKFYLDIVLPKIIFKEKNVGAMPYIVLGTLENIIIKIPDKSLVNKISNLSIVLDKKIAIEEKILNDYQLMKKYLLSNMFI